VTESTTVPLVELSRDIEASPDTVWGILTTPDLFSAWMDGTFAFEPKAGSPFRADFPQFNTVVAGEIVGVDEAARHLSLTWGVESGPQAEYFPAGCSLVDFRVVETDAGCRVELTHSRFPTERAQQEHAGGWVFHLSRLELQANRRDLEAALERTLDAWFRAWNEEDDDERLELLRSCCAEDIEYRDEWATARSLQLLSLHIGNCFRFVPGWKVDRTSEVRICRGEALFGWTGVGAGGVPQEGLNHARARPDGLLTRVTGFTAR